MVMVPKTTAVVVVNTADVPLIKGDLRAVLMDTDSNMCDATREMLFELHQKLVRA